jgi:hypothetical protein
MGDKRSVHLSGMDNNAIAYFDAAFVDGGFGAQEVRLPAELHLDNLSSKRFYRDGGSGYLRYKADDMNEVSMGDSGDWGEQKICR